jgi:hypothetical protein
MKNLLAALTVISLAGCAVVDAFLMKFDPVEFQQISDIRTTAYLAKNACDTVQDARSQSVIIANKTLTFKNYVQYTPHNDKVIAASIDLDKIAQGLRDQYAKTDRVSTAFCKIKFTSIETSAEAMQKIIGDKPR